MNQNLFDGGNNGGGVQRSNPPSSIPVNRGTTHIFYKTRMCQKFVEGSCRNGDSCTFAHGSSDLREPPPNWQELVKDNRGGGGGNWNDDQKIIHRMRICRKFYSTGECPYGEKCSFLHQSPAKFKVEAGMGRESSVIKIQTLVDANTVSSYPDASQGSAKGSYWKTRNGLAVGVVEDGVAAKPIHGPRAEALPATKVPVQHGEPKEVLKWKLAHKKLTRIYADWIDDEEDEQTSS